MIQVKIRQAEEDVRQIRIHGHALFDEPGQDIVCAGISAIVFGALNALDQMFDASVDLNVTDDDITIIVYQSDEVLQACLCFVIISLQTMEESYPEYIQIEIE